MAIAMCLTVACSGGGSGSEGGLTPVRIGSQQVAADAGLFLADRLGYFKEQGIKVSYKRLNDASAITNALASGHLEVAGATITPGTFQAQAQGLKIKIVGDKNFMAPPRGDLPAMSGTRLAVLPEYDKGELGKTLRGLRGKKLAIHSDLSIQVVYLDMLLKKYGMSLKDFDITPVLSPNQMTALKNGAVDAAVMQEPYFSQAVRSKLVKPVSDMTEELPRKGVSTTALLYGPKFVNDTETAENFMVAYMKGVRTYNDAMFYGKDKDKVVSIVAKMTGTPKSDIENSYPPGLDPNQEIDRGWLETCQKFYRDTGRLKVEGDVADMVDTSFRDHAMKELGEYEPARS